MIALEASGSNATVDEKTQVLARCAIRSNRIHDHVGRNASWARCQRAYRLALTNRWEHVVKALGAEAGPPRTEDSTDVFSTPSSWPEYKPASIDVSETIDVLFAYIKANTTPDSSGYSAAQHQKIVDTYDACEPDLTVVGQDAAWVGFWEARQISNYPPTWAADGTPIETEDEPRAAAIICEVCPD